MSDEGMSDRKLKHTKASLDGSCLFHALIHLGQCDLLKSLYSCLKDSRSDRDGQGEALMSWSSDSEVYVDEGYSSDGIMAQSGVGIVSRIFRWS